MKRVIWGILIFATLAPAQNNKKNYSLQQINCKTCHLTDVPTKQDPGLIPCPRNEMITVNQSPEKGPGVVKLDELSEKYLPVIFSHKTHSQMSQMSGGCGGCHHYNTVGPILSCSSCHSKERKRDDISKPDLQAAYHRQCIDCHKEWSHSTDCTSCHELKSSKLTTQKQIDKIKVKDHPKVDEPAKLVYETNYNKGKIVTFYHDQHVNLFGSECLSCHQKENCSRCHDKEKNLSRISGTTSTPIKLVKSKSEHHQPCFKCHADDNCTKCHLGKAMEPFNHKISTGWALNKFHEKLECTKCHVVHPDKVGGSSNKFVKLNNNCTSCHSNFKTGSFNHSVTGLKLDETHAELECSDCHTENNFSKTPDCSNCHDDKSFPKDKPGSKVKVAKK